MATKAFAVPVNQGRADQWRAFCRELSGSRSEEFADMNRRHGLTRHAAWLQQTPMGDLVVVLQEGPGAEEFMEKMASSEQPFETWMREQVTEIHPIDLQDPPDDPEQGIDWRE